MFTKWRTCVHEVTGLAVKAFVQRAEELRVVPGEIAAIRTTADYQQPIEHCASRTRASCLIPPVHDVAHAQVSTIIVVSLRDEISLLSPLSHHLRGSEHT